jgi:hypothetical protein
MSKLLTKAVAALETSVGMILAADVDKAQKRSELCETFAQFEAYVTKLGPDDADDAIDADGDRDDERNDGDTEKRADHHASTVADLLVEAGSFPHRAAALHHLLHKPGGQALLARMKKEESPPMQDTVLSIMKSGGIAGVCAAIVAKGSTTITEHELVEAATAVAAERHPELSKAQAFSKVYAAATDEARCLRDAVGIAKRMPFVADFTPRVVSGEANRGGDVDPNDPAEAIAQLKELGARKWPTASEAQQFANAFTDPVNKELAARAHRRPVAPAGGVYPMPR